MPGATWTADIDWEGDNDFTGTGEAVILRVQNRDGVTMVRGRDTIRALSPPAAGSCDFTLNNASKDYSPDNASSPLYGKLIPGVPVRVTTTAPSATNIWRGTLDDLPQQPMLRGGFVRVPCLGTLAKLKGTRVSSQVYTGYRTDQAFSKVCALAGLAATEYQALDQGKTSLTLWWCAGDDAFDMLTKILAAEGPGAAIYEDGAGVITFHSRHYRLLTARCTTSQVTFGNGSTEPKHSPPFGYEPNLKGVVNSVALTVKAATLAGADTTVWEWAGSVAIPPGETRSWYLDLADPVYNPAVTPGYDQGHVSATFTAEPGGSVPVTGARLRLDLLNDSATFGPGGPAVLVTVTSLAVLARVYSSTGEVVSHDADTSASQAKYGVRLLPTSYSPWPYIDSSVARSFANAIVAAYQEPRATVNVTVNNGHATRLAHMLAREISDRVTVQESQTGISGDVMIERIRHEVKEGGRFHTTTFGCEKVGPYGDSFVFGVSSFNTGRFGY